MGFLEQAAVDAARSGDKEFAETLDRIRRGEDATNTVTKPIFDPKQAREWQDDNAQGRTDEPYRQCLEYHGFQWWPLARLQALQLPGVELKTEGEWRWPNPTPLLAFTPRDLATGFPEGPESLDRYLRDYKLQAKLRAGKISKQDLIRSRERK